MSRLLATLCPGAHLEPRALEAETHIELSLGKQPPTANLFK